MCFLRPRPQSRRKKLALTLLLLTMPCGWPRLAQAQFPTNKAPEAESIAKTQILSRPTGAIVSLEGEYGLAGRAPYTVAHYLKGRYHIKAEKYGYENWSKDFFFTGKGNEKISIKLSPKTRLKGFYRSMLFPGWGQAYSDQRVKAGIIATAQCATLGALLYQNAKYNQALDDFNAAAAAFQQGQSDAGQRPVLLAQLNAAQAELDDRYEGRRRWALFAASIYAYNLLDLVLFFPSYHHDNVDVNLTVTPPVDPTTESFKVGVQAQF
jgi:hypothetical protein